MDKFLEQMKAVDPKKARVIQIIWAIVAGALLWWAIWFSSQTEDSILRYLFVIIFAVLVLGQRYFEKQAEWNMRTYRLALIIAVSAGLVAFVIYGLITGKLFTPAG